MELADKISRAGLLRATRAKISAFIANANALLSRGAAWPLACMALFGLQAALVLTHEPWLDEYQALQLAVEAPNIPVLLEWLRYEGHPPLWYLILRGLAHFMEPLTTLPVAALGLALAAQAAILFASPFTRAERLLLALSEFMLFDFLTVSRSLTLGVVVVIFALALWRKRWSWLAIAILPMCDFLFGILSGIFVLLKWREKQLFLPGIALWVAVGLVAAWTVIPAPDMIPALGDEGVIMDVGRWMASIGTLAIPFQGGFIFTWNYPIVPLAGIIWVGFLWFAWAQTRKDQFHRLMLIGFIGFTLAFSLLVYPLPLRHLMLIALLLIALTWLRRMRGERPGAGFRLWLAISAVCGLGTAAISFAIPFHTAHLAAAEIQRQGLQDKHWMVFPDFRAQGVSALTGVDFERTEQKCMQSFNRWDFHSDLEKPAQLVNYLQQHIEHMDGRFYLLSNLSLDDLPDDLIRPIATIDAGYDGQGFFLFEVGPGLPETNRQVPACVAGRRPFKRLP